MASGRNLHNLAPSIVEHSVAFSKDKDVNRSLASLLLSPRWVHHCFECRDQDKVVQLVGSLANWILMILLMLWAYMTFL